METRKHKRTGIYRPGGNPSISRQYVYITCPFCGRETKANCLSLAGKGKLCPCGAKHNNDGTTTNGK